MGCFSFMCKECKEPILSNSFRGQEVKLFLLRDGKIIEQMEGEYDSYGRVFDKENKKSIEWKMEWHYVCNLIFKPNMENGIAAIHSKCWKDKLPKTRSEDDPDQGWGYGGEYFADCSDDKSIP